MRSIPRVWGREDMMDRPTSLACACYLPLYTYSRRDGDECTNSESGIWSSVSIPALLELSLSWFALNRILSDMVYGNRSIDQSIG